jgi:Flp pilus assembly protein TadD
VHERSAEELAEYRARIADVAARPKLEADGAPGAVVGEELGRELRALGYVDAAAATDLPGPLEDTGLPNPHARATELELCDRAASLAAAGKRERAIEVLREVISANPRNALARELLADQLVQLRRWSEALAVFEQLLETSVERASIRAGLGRCLDQLGRREEAVVHLRRAAELDPGNVQVLRMLSVALDRTGRKEEAALWRERLQRAEGY